MFETALPVSRNEYVLKQELHFTASENDVTSADRQARAYSVVTALGYGLTPRLALFGVIPFGHKTLESGPTSARVKRSSTGLGDIRLFGRYTVFQQDGLGTTFRISPFAGLELPTGDDNKRDRLGRLPPRTQSGSGSWDVFTGLVATYATTVWQLDGQASYQLNTRANGFEAGNVLQAGFSFQYRLNSHNSDGETAGFFQRAVGVYGILEANLRTTGRDMVTGVENLNSGGTVFFLLPGLQFETGRWIFDVAVQIPAYQDLYGTALEEGPTFRTGIRANF